MTQRVLVVSATNVLARGFEVVPTERRSRGGEPVNGLFALATAVLRVLTWKTPAFAVAVFDHAARERNELLAPQVEALPALARALGLTVVEVEPEEEAAIVAAYARAAVAAGHDVVVVGMDKRYAQLVADDVWWYDANKDARYTPEMVRKRFGVGPSKVADWLALVGDDESLEGIDGVGAKGATKLLEKHDSLEHVLADLDALDGRARKALEAARAEALPRQLARARLESSRAPQLKVPLSDCAFTPPDPLALNTTLEDLGFVELLVSTPARTDVRVCTTPEAFMGALSTFAGRAPAVVALLDEASAPGPSAPGPLIEVVHAVALSLGDGPAWVVESGGAAWPALCAWLADAGAPKVGFESVGMDVALRRGGVTVEGLVSDGACLSHLTEPSGWAPHELPVVARRVLGRSLPGDDEVKGTGSERKPWSALGDAALEVAGQRADAVAAVVRRLSPGVEPRLLKEALALSEVCARMELTGMAVDAEQLGRAEAAFVALEESLAAEIAALAGHTFNISSTTQLGAVLFEELKLPVVSRNKTGYSCSNDALERIEHAHPIVGRVLRFRLLRWLRDSWVHTLRREIHLDGRVHARFNPARSFSGQLVVSRPDLSRVPGRTPEMAEIRRAFVAPPGRLLLSVDFNQLGLHVLAHLTRDPALVEPLRERADLHRLTAAAVLEKPPSEVTLEERQLGKVINFASFAGQGPSALAQQLGVAAAEAKEYLARFDRRYAQVRAFQDAQLQRVRDEGHLVTLAGRRWPVGGLTSRDPKLRSYAERLARRGTHEGSVADVSRRALLQADRALRAAGLAAFPLLVVVDEVLFEVAEDELEETARVASEAMRSCYELEVPLVVGVEAGRVWAELHPHS